MTKLNAMRAFFCLAVLLVFACQVFACQPKKKKKMLLTLRLSEGMPLAEDAVPASQCQIFASGNHYGDPTETFKFAEGQTEHTFEISLDGPKIMVIAYDTFEKKVYAEPGAELTVSLTKKGNKNEFTYACEGSVAMYMELLDSLAKPEVDFFKRHKDKEYDRYSLDWEDFDKELKDIQQHKETLMANAKGVSDEFKAIMKADSFAIRMFHLQTYERLFNQRKEEGTEDFVIPETENAYEKAFAFG